MTDREPSGPEAAPGADDEILRRYLRWRWGSLSKVTDEGHKRAEEDYAWWRAALAAATPREIPPPAPAGPADEDAE